MSFEIADRVELRIESINSRGDGVARTGTQRFVFFVPGALPGEFVTGRIFLLKKSYGVIGLEEIREPHPERVNPRCAWYGKCGGCALQHASYSLQLKIKEFAVIDAFRKIAGVASLQTAKCSPSPSEWGYRNKASFPVRDAGSLKRIGFYSQRSHELVPVDVCPVLEKKIESWINPLSSLLERTRVDAYDEKDHSGLLRHMVIRCGSHSGSSLFVPVFSLSRKDDLPEDAVEMAEMIMHELAEVGGVAANFNSHPGNTIFGGYSRVMIGNGVVEERIGGFSLKYGPTSFFQINTGQAEALFSATVEELDAMGSERVLELYSGTGALTLYIAKNRKKVHAIEDWPESVAYLRDNVVSNGFSNIEVHEMTAERSMKFLTGRKFDAVVMDPPRKGCSDKVLRGVCSLKPRCIVYISCNPATLARDSAYFLERGYNLEKVRIFDMFPQTFHVESIATFKKSELPGSTGRETSGSKVHP